MAADAGAQTQIVIVGGGPVGLGLAIELGQRGIRCILVEKYTSPQPIPKGQNLTQRTLEHFYFWGAEQELRAARTIPRDYGIGGMTAYGTLLSGYKYDWLQRELVRPFYFTDNERLPQYATEAVLRQRVGKLSAVQTLYGWSAEAATQDGHGVEVTIAERGTGAKRSLHAQYVVGCDGSRSLVREEAGITQTKSDHDRLMVLLVFRSTELHRLLERFPNKSFYNVLHPDLKGYWKFFGRVDLGTTWFFHAPVPLGTTKDNFDFRTYVHDAVGEEFEVEFEHIGFWDLRVAIADRYRNGRIFVAGDAAHSHPPYGGYGINTGLEDAANLGWKLAAQLQGWAGDGLLDTYDEERRPVFASTARDFIEKAIDSDKQFLAHFDPATDQAAFDAQWQARSSGARDEVNSFEPNYEGGSIVIGSAGKQPSAIGSHEFPARAGHHLTPHPLSSGCNVFEELGDGFTLIDLGADKVVISAIVRAAETRDVPIKVIADGTSESRDFYKADLILVRPDQFVAWTSNSETAGAEEIIRRAIGGDAPTATPQRIKLNSDGADTARHPKRRNGMSSRSAAHYFLEGLVDLGIDYIFANLGTDHVSLIEEIARWDAEGRKHPQIILCPHEVVAVHMAGGYALATGKGQAVFVHVDAGTANACMAIQNLFRYRLPVMLFAGRAPFTLHGELPGSRDTYVHFVQDPFDIASIVRPYVKWEYSLPSGVVVKEALTRASAFMQSAPPGPVYMMLPRETLAEEWAEAQMPAYKPARYGGISLGGIEPSRAEAIAARLMAAENPIALTAYLGRNHEAVGELEKLALACGIRVAEFNSIDLNISQDSPCFAGFEAQALLDTADLGLLLDTDVPFVPQYAKRVEAIEWIQIDVDPLKADFPMWGFPTDMRVQADCATVLKQVRDIVEQRADDAYRTRVANRIANWSASRTAREAKRVAAQTAKGTTGSLSAPYVFATLNDKLSQDDVIINEAIRNAPLLQEHIRRTKPGSYVGLAGGGLGFSGGMALGLKLAQPARRIVQIIGDGGFHFSSPDAVFAVAQQYEIPILTIVLDNGGWQAVKSAVQRVYPKGAAAESNAFQSQLRSGRQGEQRRFADIGRAFGAHGEHVSAPDDLPDAIDRCLAAVDGGRAAVLHVEITPL